jgi:hypothetical protein
MAGSQGKNFGEKEKGVCVHGRLKQTARTGFYEMNPETLIGGNNMTNCLTLSGVVQKWNDTAIQLNFADDYWRTFMAQINYRAKGIGTDPPLQSQIEVCYQVRRDDTGHIWSDCFYPK